MAIITAAGGAVGGAAARGDAAAGEPAERTRAEAADAVEPRTGLPARGTLLGRYSLLRKLGEGGMGVVYSAYDEELDRRVAIKLLRVRAGASSRAASRMLREAQAMAKLSHPNVVQVYDTGELSGQVFLAMEFVQGQTLREWIQGPLEAPRATPRPWREVLAMFVQAGQGLAAAHAAGLVHRDFKPDNVLVGSDGRARVLDFGLARSDATPRHADAEVTERSAREDVESSRRAREDVESSRRAREDLESSRRAREDLESGRRSRRSLDHPLTAAGTVLGTPAYMSPEQHMRVAADARSDQFSFCVALYEGIHGERPFAGTTGVDLRGAALLGRVRDPPPGRKVPAWLRKVLLRGLRVIPQERFPDMDALLAALAADPAVARRRWLTGVGLVALALLTGLLVAERRSAEAVVCRGAERLLVGVWDDERAAAVSAALAATGRAFARDAWPRVQEQLDLYARTWQAMHVEVCEATNLRRSQSSTLMDLRMTCLLESRAELRAAVDVLAGADAKVAERAVQVASGLRPLARCADPEALAAGRAPVAPAAAAAVQAVREMLSQVRAEDAAGRFARGLGLARDAVIAAERTGHGPTRAAALLHRGRMEDSAADFAAAERSLEDAYWLAEASGDDGTRAEAALRLLRLVGEPRGRDHDAMQWARQAEAVILRLGEPAALEAALRANLGVVHNRFGRYDAALAALHRAIALERRPGHPLLAVYHRDLGNVHYRRGRYRDAEVAYALAVAIGEAALGREHPDVARSVSNLGEAHRVQGHSSAAERCFLRSIAIWEDAFGLDHPLLAPPLNGLGILAFRRGDMKAAAAHFERVRDLFERSYGPQHPDVGAVTGNLGEVLLRQGELAASQRASERALKILEAALGPEHDSLADVHSNLARALALQGQPEAAARHYARAVTLLERAHGPGFPELTKPLTGQGLLALADGRPAQAVALLERALTLGGTHDPGEFAELRLALARALWDSHGDRVRGRDLAELAAAELAAPGPSPVHAPLAAALERWLAEHPRG